MNVNEYWARAVRQREQTFRVLTIIAYELAIVILFLGLSLLKAR